MLALFIHFPLLVLTEALLVDSIFVGSYRLILFFNAPLLLYYLPCTLPLLALAHISYFPFSLEYTSFIFIVLVYCWCNIIVISPYDLIYPWCFSHLPVLLIYFLWSVVLRICIFSAVFVLVSCPLHLGIFLLYPLGVDIGLTVFSPNIWTMMRVHMGV